jgi:nitric oxide reductase
MHRKFEVDGLGFGFGPHRCIAESLARAELEAVFGEKYSPLDWAD